jgi:hypothetical protein
MVLKMIAHSWQRLIDPTGTNRDASKRQDGLSSARPLRHARVTSPFAATLKAPKGTLVPQPCAVVTLGQTIFLTEPKLSPGERATLASVHLAFGRTGTRAEDEEAEDMKTGSAIGSNGPAQASQPALAAVAVPASSVE